MTQPTKEPIHFTLYGGMRYFWGGMQITGVDWPGWEARRAACDLAPSPCSSTLTNLWEHFGSSPWARRITCPECLVILDYVIGVLGPEPAVEVLVIEDDAYQLYRQRDNSYRLVHHGRGKQYHGTMDELEWFFPNPHKYQGALGDTLGICPRCRQITPAGNASVFCSAVCEQAYLEAL